MLISLSQAYTSGTLLEAGSDTTSSTLYAFVQAMLLYPEAQRKAQVQIDQVVGSARMPTMDDAPNLPYIRSIMKETLRTSLHPYTHHSPSC
jgi:cytochrome P450